MRIFRRISVALAKAEGIEITKKEAETYLAELEDLELDEGMLKNVAGGGDYTGCKEHCTQDSIW